MGDHPGTDSLAGPQPGASGNTSNNRVVDVESASSSNSVYDAAEDSFISGFPYSRGSSVQQDTDMDALSVISDDYENEYLCAASDVPRLYIDSPSQTVADLDRALLQLQQPEARCPVALRPRSSILSSYSVPSEVFDADSLYDSDMGGGNSNADSPIYDTWGVGFSEDCCRAGGSINSSSDGQDTFETTCEVPACLTAEEVMEGNEHESGCEGLGGSNARMRHHEYVRELADKDAQMVAMQEKVTAIEAEMLVQRDELAQAEARVTQIGDALQCSVCLETFTQPHSLACGHTFCLDCAVQWLTQSKQCPTCRAPVIDRPAPAFALQDVIRCLRRDAESQENSAPANSADPWALLFPRARLGRDCPENSRWSGNTAGIRRCGVCSMWRPEAGSCPHCQTSSTRDWGSLEARTDHLLQSFAAASTPTSTRRLDYADRALQRLTSVLARESSRLGDALSGLHTRRAQQPPQRRLSPGSPPDSLFDRMEIVEGMRARVPPIRLAPQPAGESSHARRTLGSHLGLNVRRVGSTADDHRHAGHSAIAPVPSRQPIRIRNIMGQGYEPTAARRPSYSDEHLSARRMSRVRRVSRTGGTYEDADSLFALAMLEDRLSASRSRAADRGQGSDGGEGGRGGGGGGDNGLDEPLAAIQRIAESYIRESEAQLEAQQARRSSAVMFGRERGRTLTRGDDSDNDNDDDDLDGPEGSWVAPRRGQGYWGFSSPPRRPYVPEARSEARSAYFGLRVPAAVRHAVATEIGGEMERISTMARRQHIEPGDEEIGARLSNLSVSSRAGSPHPTQRR